MRFQCERLSAAGSFQKLRSRALEKLSRQFQCDDGANGPNPRRRWNAHAMTNEDIFRWVLLAGLLVVLPVAAYHRLRSITKERLDRTQEGWFILVTLRLAGLGTMGGTIAYVVNPQRMAWAAVPLPDWLRWIGAGLVGLCALLLTWTLHSLGRNLTDTVVTRQEHTLVTTGPYRWVRHPFYVSVLLLVLSNALLAANWFIFACALALLTMIRLRTRIEEEKLLVRFGDEYRHYKERTGAFFPRW
jgi:protein-S-isoprenylcysteine O-methyltransferase Ste14